MKKILSIALLLAAFTYKNSYADLPTYTPITFSTTNTNSATIIYTVSGTSGSEALTEAGVLFGDPNGSESYVLIGQGMKKYKCVGNLASQLSAEITSTLSEIATDPAAYGQDVQNIMTKYQGLATTNSSVVYM